MHGIKREKFSKDQAQLKIKRDESRINHYKKLSSSIFAKRDAKQFTANELHQTTELLDLNPEFYTIWNYRREILTELFTKLTDFEKNDLLKQELTFTLAQFKKNSKCYWIWNHRIWCLQQDPLSNWDHEFLIVDKILGLDSRNFHGWQYRRIIVSAKEDKLIKEGKADQVVELNLKEFEYTTKMINRNISNFSSWHNRTKLIEKLLINPPSSDSIFKDSSTVLTHELNLVKHAMYTDVEDSSVWIYLRWLLTSKIFVDNLTEATYKDILKAQLVLIEELNELEMDDNGKDNKWCLQSIVFINKILSDLGEVDENSNAILEKLTTVDPLRKNRYLDLIK